MSNTIIPKRATDLRGRTFGLWTVLEYAGNAKNSRHALWLVRCSCPKKTESKVEGYTLVRGGSQSCGCLRANNNLQHGMTGTPEYEALHSILQRTENPNHPSYHRYGGRGIKLSGEFKQNNPAFFEHIGKRPSPLHSIDRIDNNKGYERGNLKWSTRREQALNRSNNRHLAHGGVIKAWAEWDVEYGFPKGTVKNRVKLGWSAERIFSTPVEWFLKNKKPHPVKDEV